MNKNQKISVALMHNENGKYNRKFFVDTSIFDKINNEAKAYWLGFIMADGWVSVYPEHYIFGMRLSIKDRAHLLKLKQFLGAEHKVGYRGENDQYCQLVFNSKDFVCRLLKLGVVPNKSKYLVFPGYIKTDLENHFIRGYFDGDGWITINKKYGLAFGIVGNKNFLGEVQRILMVNCDLRKTKLLLDRRHKTTSTISLVYGGNLQCRRIRDYLYRDATVFLGRKERTWNAI